MTQKTYKDGVYVPTKRTMEVYKWIYEETCKNGIQPSYRDVIRHFGKVSTNVLTWYVKMMKLAGYIGEPVKGKSRSIRFILTPDGEPFRGFTNKREE